MESTFVIGDKILIVIEVLVLDFFGIFRVLTYCT